MDTKALTAVAVLAALVAVAVLAGRRRRHPLTVVDLAISVAVLGTLLIAAVAPIVVLAEFSPFFDVAHLGYLGLFVGLPMVGVAALALGWRRGATRPTAVVAAMLVVAAPVGWYGTHVAPYQLEQVTATQELRPGRAGSGPVRVGVLADLQTTRVTGYEQRAVTELLELEPDLIVLPGDVFQGDERQLDEGLDEFRALLARLEAPGGVYAVRGDVDTGDRLDRLVEGTQIRILDDEIATARVGDRGILVGGNQLRWAPEDAVAMRRELQAANPAMVRILVAHRPEVVLGLGEDADVDLTVAGHTHGGQVALPGWGPLVVASPIPRSVAAGGLHEVDGNPLFVSTGVGVARGEAPQVRLFTRPMVAVVELR